MVRRADNTDKGSRGNLPAIAWKCGEVIEVDVEGTRLANTKLEVLASIEHRGYNERMSKAYRACKKQRRTVRL